MKGPRRGPALFISFPPSINLLEFSNEGCFEVAVQDFRCCKPKIHSGDIRVSCADEASFPTLWHFSSVHTWIEASLLQSCERRILVALQVFSFGTALHSVQVSIVICSMLRLQKAGAVRRTVHVAACSWNKASALNLAWRSASMSRRAPSRR